MRWLYPLLGLALVSAAGWSLGAPRATARSRPLPEFSDIRGAVLQNDTSRFAGMYVVRPLNLILCSFPTVPDDALVVQLSTIKAEGVPTVTLGSQDNAVSTATIAVEPGSRQLYIVAVSETPVIWRVTGDTARVHRIVVGQRNLGHDEWSDDSKPLAGVTGLPESKVSFLPHHSCVPPHLSGLESYTRLLAQVVRRGTGHVPALMADALHVSAYHVPSGQVSADIAHSKWRQFLRYPEALLIYLGITGPQPNKYERLGWKYAVASPDGVIAINPDRVVADVHTEPYRILPGYAGLDELVRAGKLEDMGWDQYHIRQAIQFPPGLPSRVNFLLMKGVPMPGGDPGESCVVSEETHAQLAKHCMAL